MIWNLTFVIIIYKLFAIKKIKIVKATMYKFIKFIESD